jgi:transposase InsO family protein
MREERILIPTKLRPDVLAAGHEGCPGRESMLKQLRLSVWWPGMSADVKEFTESCLGCTAATPRTRPPPMQERETPAGPWQHCSADFKGPIGGDYYFHVMIDNYSRWPEVEVVKSTSFAELKPALERSFGLLGVPLSVTHDRGPPYTSHEWRKFSKETGFESRPCTPEHPEGNGLAERFMSVLVKTVHAAKAQGKDPQVEVRRRVMNYRNTPHKSTNKTPAELIMNRRLRTKIPCLVLPAEGRVQEEAREKDRESRKQRKEVRDSKRRAQERTVKPGDEVLVQQKKTSIQPPFDPKPYKVTEVNGSQVTATRGNKTRIRNMSKLKVVKERPDKLKVSAKYMASDTDSDDDYIDLKLPEQEAPKQLVNQEQKEGGQQLEEQEERRYPQRERRPNKNKNDLTPHKAVQLSPQQRRKKKAEARKRPRELQEDIEMQEDVERQENLELQILDLSD